VHNDVKAVVLGWTNALNQHDPDKAAAFISEDCVFVNVGNGRRFVGRAAIRDDFANLFGMWSEVDIEVTNYFENGQHWVGEWNMTGVHTGDAPGLPATGQPFRFAGVGVGQVRDGQIVQLTEYWNMAEFLTQVGILPPPAQ
jgi:steroid delta-isomerase-like uncharacterized protein